MIYTRRSLLRDAALLSAAGAVGVRPASASCATATTGVRVFFAGAWLFCKDPKSTLASPTMLAVTLDPSKHPIDSMDVQHYFPYGPWVEPPAGSTSGYWNQHNNCLNLCPFASPYPLTIGNPGTPLAMYSLFTQTNSASRFTYLSPLPGVDRGIVDNGDLVVIRLPIPMTIIPTGYRTNASIQDLQGQLQTTTDTTKGFATMHIFQYPGATSLQFQADSLNVPHGGFLDYHFHTVSKAKTMMPCHAPRMFHRVIGLFTPPATGLTLVPEANGTEVFGYGSCTIDSITKAELEQPRGTHHPWLINLATCDAGGVGG